MGLGNKIRQARQEAGLSQRQLCGQVITRNMLSLIESEKASPSMATLQYLAARLGKSIGFFLDENVAVSDNINLMAQARQAYAHKKYSSVLSILRQYHSSDPLFDQEQSYLQALSALALGQQLLQNADPFQAVPLLENLDRSSLYYREDMEHQRRRLLLDGYEQLELHYREQCDFQSAYFYACKSRTLIGKSHAPSV